MVFSLYRLKSLRDQGNARFSVLKGQSPANGGGIRCRCGWRGSPGTASATGSHSGHDIPGPLSAESAGTPGSARKPPSDVAAAFGVRRDAVTLVAGASSRTKIVDVAAGDPGLLAELLAGPPR